MEVKPPATYAHAIARAMVRPLLGTPVTPNHLTTARLLIGLGSAVAFAVGEFDLGGLLFVVSALLDRADGELARIGGKTTPWGHKYDLYSDALCNVAAFIGIGLGLWELQGAAAPVLGLAAGVGIGAIFAVITRVEAEQTTHDQVFAGNHGFDPDDALFLIGPIAWAGFLWPFLIAAGIGAPAFALGCLFVFRRILFKGSNP